MEYRTMNCYRCNAPMAAGGYIHCSTCRTEDALKNQTNKILSNQSNDVNVLQALSYIVNETNRHTFQSERPTYYPYVGPTLTKEDLEAALVRVNRDKKRARNERISIAITFGSILIGIGVGLYYFYNFLMSFFN